MAGANFIIIAVDLAVKNFPPMKSTMQVHDDGRGHKHRRSAANNFQY